MMRTLERVTTTSKSSTIHHVEQNAWIDVDILGSSHSSHSSHAAHAAHTAHTAHVGERGASTTASKEVGWVEKVIAIVIPLAFSVVLRFQVSTYAKVKKLNTTGEGR